MTTTDTTTDDTDATAVPPAPRDSFAAAMALIELAINPRELQGRLADLKATEDRVAKELRRLELARQSHERAIAKDRAEIQEERAALARRLVAVEAAERGLEADKARLAAFRQGEDRRRLEMLPGGTGARDWGPNGMYRDDAPPDRSSDPHFGRQAITPPAETTELERVPGAGHTLSRSIPKPRRTMRRVQPDA